MDWSKIWWTKFGYLSSNAGDHIKKAIKHIWLSKVENGSFNSGGICDKELDSPIGGNIHLANEWTK